MLIGHKRDDGTKQSILAHLTGTADYAERFASAFGESNCAKVIAFAHDIGKYSAEFQKRIKGANIEVDHSTAGARVLADNQNSPLGLLAAYCVMGHHGGLPDGGSKSQHQSLPGTLYYRLTDSNIPDYSSYLEEIELALPKQPKCWNPVRGIKKGNVGFSLSFFTRMLFSCLVDADWLDTEAFMRNNSVKRRNFESIDLLCDKLSEHLKGFDNPAKEINKRRTALRDDCIKAAKCKRGLFSLTAPTGSGKTKASLAFALNHAVKNKMEHVIYVVPYNTIIEQNAKVFEDILGAGNVVQHHSNIEYDDQDPRRFATENWDAPIIVTSNVQFFESLFANKPGKCRKLHNIANSVIVFDEAQMLPLPYLIPCVAAIGELVRNCNCSAVLTTATQSSLDEYFFPLIITEINSAPKQMYEDFRRVTYIIEDEPFLDERLVSELSNYNQVLCIVNTRKKAQEIASKIDHAYHLSTTMYPAHRAEILKEIRDKLENHKPCRVISTSLIEAGVDVDFPAIYREKAGLDSIIQAAGRCNRDAKNSPQASFAHVFTFESTNPPAIIQQNIAAFEHTRQSNSDIASLQAIKCYFKQLRYIIGQEGLDRKNTVQQFNEGICNAFSFPFKTAAEQFHLIEDDQRTIVVENDSSKTLCNLLRIGKPNRSELRQIQQFSINVYPRDFENLCKCSQLEVLDNGVAIINERFYDDKFGVSL